MLLSMKRPDKRVILSGLCDGWGLLDAKAGAVGGLDDVRVVVVLLSET